MRGDEDADRAEVSVPRIAAGPARSISAGSAASRTSSWRLAMVDFSLAAAAKRILEALSLVRGEQLTILSDRARLGLTAALVDAAEQSSARATVVLLEDLGTRPLVRVTDSMRSALAASQASVFLASFERLERTMRAEVLALAERYRLRHGHMVSVTRRAWESGFNADPARIASAARAVRTRVRPGSTFRATGRDGTDLTVRCHASHRWVEHSGIVRPGKWENLPTGELVTTPLDVTGVFVCNASMSESFGERAGFLRGKPMRFVFEGGYVRSVTSPDAALEREVRSWLMHADHLDRAGLVVLGTNVGMRDPVGEILSDQNLPGLHLGLGATFAAETGAAWDAAGQLVIASAYCDVDLDGAPLVRGGRYLDVT